MGWEVWGVERWGVGDCGVEFVGLDGEEEWMGGGGGGRMVRWMGGVEWSNVIKHTKSDFRDSCM